MYLEVITPKDFLIGDMIDLINEIDKYVIDYEFGVNKWKLNLLTIPSNEKVIREIVSKYSKNRVTTR